MKPVARAGLIATAVIMTTVAGTGAASALPPTDPGHCGQLVRIANQKASGGGGAIVSRFAHDHAVSALAASQCEGVG